MFGLPPKLPQALLFRTDRTGSPRVGQRSWQIDRDVIRYNCQIRFV